MSGSEDGETAGETIDLTQATSASPGDVEVSEKAESRSRRGGARRATGRGGDEDYDEDDDDEDLAEVMLRKHVRTNHAMSMMVTSTLGLGDRQRVTIAWRDLAFRVPALSDKLLQKEALAWAKSTGGSISEFFEGYDTASVDVSKYRRMLRKGDAPPEHFAAPLPREGTKELKQQIARYKGNKRVLSTMSGHAAPGTLTCIMGASGAGKTSLIELLVGRQRPTSGQILFNGAPIKSLARWHRLVAYVPQSDVLLPSMTVRETLYFYADLKLDRSKLSQSERHAKADELIHDLHLEKAASTPIGDDFLIKGVSGGERKRVSIAVALLTNPSIIVLDEPTSGLDSSTAYSLIGILSQMAHVQQRTVLCTIHQPSSQMFAAFDRLLLLVDGQLAFQGPVPKVVSYLRHIGCPCPSYTNPADRMMDLVTCYGATADDDNVAPNRPDLNRFDMSRDQVPDSDKSAHAAGSDDIGLNSSIVNMSSLGSASSKSRVGGGGDGGGLGESLARSKDAIDLVTGVSHMRRYLVAYYLQSDMAKRVDGFVPKLGSASKKSVAPSAGVVDSGLAESLGGEGDGVVQDGPRTTFFQQYRLLYMRNWLRMRRNPLLVKVRFMQVMFNTLLMGIIFLRLDWNQSGALSRIGFCGFLMISFFFTTSFNMIQTFPLERNVFIRDRASRMYDVLPYYLAIITADLPIQLFFATVAATITYWMTNMNDDGLRFAQFLAVSVMAINLAAAIGLTVGAGVPSIQVGAVVGPMLTVFFTMFSGVFVTTDQIPVWLRWLIYASPLKYSVEALQWIALHDMPVECDSSEVPTPSGSTPPPPNFNCDTNNGNDFLRIYDTQDAVWWRNLCVLAGMYVLARVLGFVVLYFYDRSVLNPIRCCACCGPCCCCSGRHSTDDDDDD